MAKFRECSFHIAVPNFIAGCTFDAPSYLILDKMAVISQTIFSDALS